MNDERTLLNLAALRGFTRATPWGVDRIVSDAQSGAARGALDAAIALGLNHGGWGAFERHADDGELDEKYRVRSCRGGFGERVAHNIRDSDGTMLLSFGSEDSLDNRTSHALKLAKLKRRACVHLQLPYDVSCVSTRTLGQVRAWLQRCKVGTLHVVGPLERKAPGLARATCSFLERVLAPEETS
jgi:hypothetical protein